MPGDGWVLVGRENIRIGYPSCRINQEHVFVAARMPQVDDLLIITHVVLSESSVRIWPAPGSEDEEWLMLVNCAETGNEVYVNLDELGIRYILRRVVSSDMNYNMRCGRYISCKIPRCGEIVVGRIEVSGVFGLGVVPLKNQSWQKGKPTRKN